MPDEAVVAAQPAEIAVDKTGDLSTAQKDTATPTKSSRPHVREERAVGGRFVSLGGGEREFIPEESTAEEDGTHPQHADDSVFYRK